MSFQSSSLCQYAMRTSNRDGCYHREQRKNREKKRNLSKIPAIQDFDLGKQNDWNTGHLRERGHLADHGLAECVPWADKESVENLIEHLILRERMSRKEKVKLCIPDFPNVFIAYLVCVNADKTPNSENLRSNYSEYFQLACRILLTKIQNTTKSNI